MKEYLLAIDTGTSVTKAILYDSNLNPTAIARRHYPIFTPRFGWNEQDPDMLFHYVVEAMREALQGIPADGELAGIAISSQMYSVLAVSPQGKPLTRSLTWSDTRSAGFARQFARHPDAEPVSQNTGCPIDAIYPLSKIAWIKENYRLPAETRFISMKEYIVYRLTGQFLTDWSVASSSGMMDIHTHQWDPAALAMVGVGPENLSVLASPRCQVIDWRPEIAAELGISPGTPLVLGGGDGPLASLGVGAFTPDVVTVNVGTSAAARCILSQPIVDPNHRLWTYALDEGMWVMGGVTSSGGVIYDWFLKQFFPDVLVKGEPFPQHVDKAAVEKMASAIPPGSEGLLFTPYLSGEQCPDWQPYSRGSYFGLDLTHTRAHMARAVLEGITHSIYRIIETIQLVLGSPFWEVRVTGGLGASALWTQIAADLFGMPLAVPNPVEGSACGAAMLGWTALGRVGSLKDFDSSLITSARVYPHQDVHDVYQQQHQDFLQILEYARTAGLARHQQAPEALDRR